MILVRFKMRCKPQQSEAVRAALEPVIAPSRAIAGCVAFDIARDLADPNSFIATEVFADKEALARQEKLPEVQKVLDLLPAALAAEPEATIYSVSSSERWG